MGNRHRRRLGKGNRSGARNGQAAGLGSSPSSAIAFRSSDRDEKSEPASFRICANTFLRLPFYAEYDPPTRTLAYVNAGQNPPIVIRCEDGRSKVFRLESDGIPVGLFENSNYRSANFQLQAGDILVACTDGIMEMEDQEGKQWGQQRLEDLFSICDRRTPGHVVRSILREVSAFARGRAPQDDMTLIVLQVDL